MRVVEPKRHLLDEMRGTGKGARLDFLSRGDLSALDGQPVSSDECMVVLIQDIKQE